MTDDISSPARPRTVSPEFASPVQSVRNLGASFRALRISPTIFGVLGVIALWFLRRPYVGVWHDARIYMGKGLADLDPSGVGSDLFFKYDAQSSFSVFSKIVDVLVPLMGYSGAAQFLTVLALALWLVAFAGLALRLSSGRLFWAILVAVAAARGSYGSFEILHYAESFATPRPFAEAAVLAALSALLGRAYGRMAFLLVIAAAFHPLMALAGAGTVYVYFCQRNWRWLWLALFSAVGALTAGFVGAPLLAHLVERYDPQWLLVLRLRSTYLFPSMWGEAAYPPILVQSATLLFAALTSPPRLRRFFLAVLAAALAGLAVSYFFGDLLPLVLVVQAQTWRSLWLLSVFGAVAMCFSVPRLWTQGPAGRAALGLFAMAWISPEFYEGAAMAYAALALYAARSAISLRIARLLSYASGGVATLCLAGTLGVYAFASVKAFGERSPAGFTATQIFALTPLVPTALVVLTLIWASSEFRLPYRFLGGVATALALALCSGWSAPGPYERRLAEEGRPQELQAMLADHPGEVLWIGENEAPWILLGRANWASYLQGGGAVFSRPLALAWADRMLAMLDNDWVEPTLFDPQRRKGAVEKSAPTFTRDRIEHICGRPDAPAWILGSVASRDDAPQDLSPRFWRGPDIFASSRNSAGVKQWIPLRLVAAFDCALFAAPPR